MDTRVSGLKGAIIAQVYVEATWTSPCRQLNTTVGPEDWHKIRTTWILNELSDDWSNKPSSVGGGASFISPIWDYSAKQDDNCEDNGASSP